MRAQMDFAVRRISSDAFTGVGMLHLRTCPRRQRLVHVAYDVHTVSTLFLLFGMYDLRRTLMLLRRNAWRPSSVCAAALSLRSRSTTMFRALARVHMYRVAVRCLKTCGEVPVVLCCFDELSRLVQRAGCSASSGVVPRGSASFSPWASAHSPHPFSEICLCASWMSGAHFFRRMEAADAGGRTKVKHDYVRFFAALGVADTGKLQTLARLLHAFYDVATKLDAHLDPIGASLHASVSRMCEADNPTAPPQHKWIRVVDRLGFFSDTDAHACRVVNVGLSYAYRHHALDIVTAANTVRLSQLHHVTASPAGLEQGTAAPEQVPAGGIVVPRVPGSSVVGGSDGPAGAAASQAPGDVDAAPNVDDDLDLPMGGLLVPRAGSATAQGDRPRATGTTGSGGPGASDRANTSGGAAGSDKGDAVPDGGIVVASRLPPLNLASGAKPVTSVGGGPLPGRASLVDGDSLPFDDIRAAVVCESQPVITPSAGAVSCVKGVLNTLRDRADIRDVLHKLTYDGLFCLARLRKHTVAISSEASQSAPAPVTWPDVRAMVYRSWPVWNASLGDGDRRGTLPPPGTVAFLSHPTRLAKGSRWAVDVNIAAVHEVVAQLGVKSARYFDKHDLPDVVTLQRVGPNVRTTILISIATMLMVGTQEDRYCEFLAELASSGRAPQPKVIAVAAALCHEFETAGLDAPQVGTAGSKAGAVNIEPGVAGAVAAPAGATVDPVSSLEDDAYDGQPDEDLYAEMDVLLAQEQAEEAVKSRANRLAARRRARPALASAPAGRSDRASIAPPADPAEPPSLGALSGPSPRLPPVVNIKRRRLCGGEKGVPPGQNLQALLSLCPPRRSKSDGADKGTVSRTPVRPAAEPVRVARGPVRGAPASAATGAPAAGVAASPSRNASTGEWSGVAASASREGIAVIAPVGSSDIQRSQPDGLSPLLPGASSPSCPPPDCTPEQLNAFLAAHGDDSSGDSSSSSSMDEPIAARRLAAGVAVDMAADVGDQLLLNVPGAQPFPSPEEHELRRQRVAASYAAAQSSLAAVRALRNPTDEVPPDADAPS